MFQNSNCLTTFSKFVTEKSYCTANNALVEFKMKKAFFVWFDEKKNENSSCCPFISNNINNHPKGIHLQYSNINKSKPFKNLNSQEKSIMLFRSFFVCLFAFLARPWIKSFVFLLKPFLCYRVYFCKTRHLSKRKGVTIKTSFWLRRNYVCSPVIVNRILLRMRNRWLIIVWINNYCAMSLITNRLNTNMCWSSLFFLA